MNTIPVHVRVVVSSSPRYHRNRYSQCETLVPQVARAWAKVYRKRQALNKAAKAVKKSLSVSQDAAVTAGGMILDAAEVAAKAVDAMVDSMGDIASSAGDAASSGDPVAAILVGASAVTLKAFGAYHAEQISAKSKSDEGWWSTAFTRAGSVVGLTGSIVAACFDPTGLSILSVVASVASSGMSEGVLWQERLNWSDLAASAST